MTVPTASQRQLNCARCGAAFTCEVGTGHCWCANEAYRVPMPTDPDQDCLCPACLRAHAEQVAADHPR
jgi:hypothetical protein